MKHLLFTLVLLFSFSGMIIAQIHTPRVKVEVIPNDYTGIGVEQPLYPLHISGDAGSSDPLATMYVNSTSNHGGIVLNSSTSKQNHLRFSMNNALQWQFRIPNHEGSTDLRLYSWGSTSDIMTWKHSNGFVGIGTKNPTSPLHVSGDAGSSEPLATMYVNSTSNHGGIVLNSPISKQSHLRFSTNNTLQWQFRIPNHEGSTDFRLYSWGSGSDIMTWKHSNGHVGIGTTGPDAKLEVRNDVDNSALNLYNDNQGVKISNLNTTAGSYSVLKLETRTDPDGAYMRAINRANNNVDFGIGKYQSAYGGVSVEWLTILNSGNIGIGTASPSEKLHVNGKIRATGQVGWSDFVFEDNYDLPSLEEVSKYIKKKGHLQDIPSEAEVIKEGYNLGDMDAKLLQKVEELTLYLIEQNKRLDAQQKEIEELKKQIKNGKRS